MRYKFMCLLIAIIMALSLCACGQIKNLSESEIPSASESAATQGISEDASSVPTMEQSSNTEENAEQSRILIAYFTWVENAVNTADVDASSSASILPPGNVAQMAAWIQQGTGGDLFSIQVEEPYSADYDECLERAADEKAEDARPILKGQIENIADYDTIFIGYPNWWYTAPMAVFSFLEEYDLAGKRVVLFCSHGTGGLASSVKDISVVLPDSTVESNVLGVYRDDISESQETIENWLKEIGY